MSGVFYVIGAMVGLLGLAFVIGNQGVTMRIVVGLVLLGAAGALVVAARLRPKVEQRNIVQRVDVSGNLKASELTCKQCGATLGNDDVKVAGGVAVVSCGYCKASYQLEEEPQW